MKKAFIYLAVMLASFSEASFAQDSLITSSPVGMTVDQFNVKVKTSSKPLLVYFSAEWCVVCRRQRPVLNQVMQETAGQVDLLTLDMEGNPLIAEYFEVDGLPALILYDQGYMIWNRVGFQEKSQIMSQLQGLLKRK
jgi:thioredoxin-like negative regulator of GroEL